MSVIGFDFDSTLVKAFTAEPLPGVAARIAALPPEQRIFIATNQAGPVYRAVTGESKYPTAQKVASQLADGLQACGLLDRPLPLLIMIATAAPQLGTDPFPAAGQAATEIDSALSLLIPRHALVVTSFPTWRKPQPGMLLHAALVFDRAPVVYVGDMESDRQAAAAAGAQYLDVADWMRGGNER